MREPPDQQLRWIDGGGAATPEGFLADGTYTGIRTYGPEPRRDLGVLYSDRTCSVAAVFTRNQVTGPAVLRGRQQIAVGHGGRAILVNSGNANTATGEQGVRDCERLAETLAAHLGIDTNEVWIGSTGVIGRLLPMPILEQGVGELRPTREGGVDFSRAILTTDTRPKEVAVSFDADGQTYHVGGCAKGSGMIHPDMATMFAFLTTDASVEAAWLQAALTLITDRTFNMLDIDMDTSTSDTVVVLANGAAGGATIGRGHPAAGALAGAIEEVARHLTRELARDGEGAETLIEAVVDGSATVADARLAARTIVSSPLVKTMVTGRDPNWGRVMMAIGRSGARVDQTLVTVWVGPHCVLERGTPTAIDLDMVSAAMSEAEVQLRVDLGLGDFGAVAWGCNLTQAYVSINADYTT